jgi:hypothetical protein
MSFSIVHISARTRPDLVVQVLARADDRSVLVTLDNDVIRRLCGTGERDEQALRLALMRHTKSIENAIHAYILARGVPFDDKLVLSWDDFSRNDQELVAKA